MELKKNPKLDYRKKSALFFNIGLVMSLLFVISAFEWKVIEDVVIVEKPTSFFEEDLLSPPITVNEPPKPKVHVVNLIEIENDEEIEEPEIEYVIDIERSIENEPEYNMEWFPKTF